MNAKFRERRAFTGAGFFLAALAGVALVSGVHLSAQLQMPDPKEMSGIPRPDGQMSAGSVSVRLIKGDLSNNITNHPVELHVGDKVQTLKTDDAGRVEFTKLPAGTSVKAVAVVDGERLESQEFPAPSEGGIRLMLVATDAEKERRKAEDAKLPPISGQVAIGGDSRIVIEPSDESVSVIYMLEIINTARAPVNVTKPFVLDVPKTAVSVSLLQGSSPLATVDGHTVRVSGPFPSGTTIVDVSTEWAVTSGTLDVAQAFPAGLESLVVIAKKVGDLKLASPQLERQQDTAVQGTPVIIGAGGSISAGQAVSLTLSGLPHHSSVPRQVSLALAALVAIVGIWFSTRPEDPAQRGAERKRLVARREKLLQDLVRLENDKRRGRIDAPGFTERREELLTTLERVYRELDDDTSPGPTGRTGVAA